MENRFIDLLGIGLEILVVMVFFETFWVPKKVKRGLLMVGILLIAAISILAVIFLQNTVLLPIVYYLTTLALSYYFVSSVTYKVFLSFAITAFMFAVEMLVFILIIRVLNITAEQIQTIPGSYLPGVLVSKLFALLLVYILRVFIKKGKQESNMRFNLLMAFLPVQSIILCYIVYGYSVSIDALQSNTLGIVAVAISLSLVIITMHILNNQLKALAYKKEFELAQARLRIQIEHYQQLYQNQHEVRAIRHSISNSLAAISGMLTEGLVDDAIERINGIHSDAVKTSAIVNTGLPPVDAVLTAKIARAKESNIRIKHNVLIDDTQDIDQFDMAIIIADALDNAIEGIARSTDVDRSIMLNIAGTTDYISIIVENYTSEPVNEGFRTSKPDKDNHGFGIMNMKSIAQKYDGDIKPVFSPETGKFSLMVLLRNRAV